MATTTLLVHFMITGGEVVPEIDMPISATILNLKERIETVLGISIPRQTLSFNGHVLSNDRTLTFFHFAESPIILVLAVEPLAGEPKFNIMVKSHGEQIFNIGVKETTLVRELKGKIERDHGVLTKNITLHRLSKEMEDDFPLSVYYVSEGSEVKMTILIEPR